MYNTKYLFYRIVFLLILLQWACGTKKQTTTIPQNNIQNTITPAPYNQYINNKKLQQFIQDWHGTPYLLGGNTKAGIDCSGFTMILYKNVYNTTIPRVSYKQQKACDSIDKAQLKEGDLLFFKINSANVNHTGVYLSNNYFVHVSTSKGVQVASLNSEYYKKYFYCGGRLVK